MYLANSPEQYVLPGTIIYKQRGTIWFPGENTIMGRDHTIHSAIAGYVKYYRDPFRHPTRQYIGVTYERNDRLPYHPHAARKRKLGMVAIPRRVPRQIDPLTRSGIPRRVIRKEGYVREGEPDKVLTRAEASKEASEAAVDAAEEAAGGSSGKEDKASRYVKGGETKAARAARRWNAYVQIKRTNRVLYVSPNYAYRESNFQIGRLMGKHKGKTPGTQRLGSRSAFMRHRRKKMDEKLRMAKELVRQQALISGDASNKNTGKQGKQGKKAAKASAKAEKKSNKAAGKKQKA